MDVRALDLLGPELPGPHEHGAEPAGLGADDVALEVVADHPRHPRVRVERLERRVEVRRRRLAEDRRLDLRRELEAGDERAGVEHRPVLRLPPAVAMQREEVGAHLDLAERAGDVRVREDARVLLGILAQAADEDGVDVEADELHLAGEVVGEARHREREHALPGELPRGDRRGRLQLVVLELDPEAAQVVGQRRARPRRRVRHEPQPVAVLAQPRDGLGRPPNRLARDVQDPVDVQEDRGHRGRV